MKSYPKSKAMFERAQKSLVGGVGGTARGSEFGYRPHPLFMKHGKGSMLYDEDGNSYIDYLCAFGPLILGHRPSIVNESIKDVIDNMGSILGTCHHLEAEAAEKVIDAVPCYERIRFGNTGSEVVQAALRIARAYTGRTKILRFEGHYHGLGETVHFSFKPPADQAGPYESPRPIPGSLGIPEALATTLIICPWNDSAVFEKIMDEYGSQLAAVIAEPVLANCGVIPPKDGFLSLLRRLSEKHGVVLIFDEIKTGFRLALGGAQEYYGIVPDLAVTAKAIAAGIPLAAVGGRKELMESISLHRVAQSATYQTNPIAMAACKAALDEMARPGFYERLFKLGEDLQCGLRKIADELAVPVVVQGVGPLFQIFFSDRPLTHYREVVQYTKPEEYAVFWQGLLERGVLINPSQQECWFVSNAHTEEDVDKTLVSVREALAEVKKSLIKR